MPLSPVFLRALVFEDLLVNRPEHSEREGSSRSATKGLEEAALGSTEGGSGQTQALSILMLPHLPKSGQRQPEAEEQKHNFHQKDVSCPRMSVSLKLVLHMAACVFIIDTSPPFLTPVPLIPTLSTHPAMKV